jgi:transcription elongation factor S-II
MKNIIENKLIEEAALNIAKKIMVNWKRIYRETKKDKERAAKSLIESDEKIEIPQLKLREDEANNILSGENKIKYKARLEKEERDLTKKNAKILIYDSLMNLEDDAEKVYELTIQIEEELIKASSEDKKFNKEKYLKQVKLIISNLKNNKEIANEILTGTILPNRLSNMRAGDFLSNANKEQRKKLEEDAFNSRRSDWNRLKHPGKPGIYKCGKCKGNKTTYYQAQIRRADEPMTTFITCLDCNHSWKQ